MLTIQELDNVWHVTVANANFHGGSNKHQKVYWDTIRNDRFMVIEHYPDKITIKDLHPEKDYNQIHYHCQIENGNLVLFNAVGYTDTRFGTLCQTIYSIY